jgi:hypothetical protein
MVWAVDNKLIVNYGFYKVRNNRSSILHEMIIMQPSWYCSIIDISHKLDNK